MKHRGPKPTGDALPCRVARYRQPRCRGQCSCVVAAAWDNMVQRSQYFVTIAVGGVLEALIPVARNVMSQPDTPARAWGPPSLTTLATQRHRFGQDFMLQLANATVVLEGSHGLTFEPRDAWLPTHLAFARGAEMLIQQPERSSEAIARFGRHCSFEPHHPAALPMAHDPPLVPSPQYHLPCQSVFIGPKKAMYRQPYITCTGYSYSGWWLFLHL
ncbi:unnamed protein product [Periconia digitata]|uniref:Uncharacterized protein n=1 Tax=Periconia digitata TaxID=1303443 RepID=A0A9W4UMM4_9PLEO|nr:unnamed protein product [Periconia digitata]